MEARIIKLGPNTSVSSVATFEEAFGEFSEIRGSRRKRRQQKRQDRIEAKQERRRTRRAGRAEAAADRQAKRASRQASRQERRMSRTEARLTRKSARDAYREEKEARRRELQNQEQQDENALPADENQVNENVNSLPPNSAPKEQENTQEESQDNTGRGYSNDRGSYGNGNYSEEENTEDGYSEEDNNEESDSEEGDYENSEDDEYGFDGVMGAEDRYLELADDNNIQKINVSPEMVDMANKYEWNKELACRLIMKKADAIKHGMPTEGINEQIADRKNRMNEIKASFNDYLNFDADFSECCGMSSAEGIKSRKKNSNRERKKREHQVKKALHIARNNRESIKNGSVTSKLSEANRKENKIRYYGGDVTPVESELNPEFSKNRIVIPGEMNSNASGNQILTNGLGSVNDADAPPIREVFIGTDGEQYKTIDFWGAIAALGLVCLFGYAITKKM